MTQEEIKAKRDEAETKFNTLRDENIELQKKIEANSTEITKLQGEYRAFTTLLNEDPLTITAPDEQTNEESEA